MLQMKVDGQFIFIGTGGTHETLEAFSYDYKTSPPGYKKLFPCWHFLAGASARPVEIFPDGVYSWSEILPGGPES